MKSIHTKGLALVVIGFAIVGGADKVLKELATAPCPVRSQADSNAFPEQSSLVGFGKAAAIPAFARKFNMTCTTCHTAFPYLNTFGRTFKRAGYRIVDEDGIVDPDMQNRRTISKNLTLDETFPIALGIEGAPLRASFVEGAEDEVTLAPFGALNLIGAGNFAWEGSYYATITAEMESDPDAFVTAHGMVGWHPSPYVNIVGGHADPFHHDPYNSLSPHGITAAHAHKSQSQFIQGYGYTGPLFYSVGLSGGGTGRLSDDMLGYGRVALEFSPQIAFGTFGFVGQRSAAAMMEFQLLPPTVEVSAMALGGHDTAVDPSALVLPSEDYVRIGGDLNMDIGNVYIVAVGEYRHLAHAANDLSEFSGFGELYYLHTLDDRPIFVPLIRVDAVHNLESNARRLSLAGNVSSYVTPNSRVGLEYGADVLKPQEVARRQSLTVFAKAYW